VNTWFEVRVALRGTKDELVSPHYASEDEAAVAVAEIRRAQQANDFPDLPWLSVSGRDILAASIKRRSAGVVGIA